MSNSKVIQWGVLGNAKIARDRVIPALQSSSNGQVLGIASRDEVRARKAADEMGIERSYGSYESLLADSDIDAVYIPLPNNLHVPVAIQAMEAGKHVLIEKPIAMNAREVEQLIEASKKYPQLKVMEAFMYRFHPQWEWLEKEIKSGAIGDLRSVQVSFFYNLDDPENIRSSQDMGGGGLLDIGGYTVTVPRWIFGEEPEQTVADVTLHPKYGVDILASGYLKFPSGCLSFTLGTCAEYHERVIFHGSEGMIQMTQPYNTPVDAPTKIIVTKNEKTWEVDGEPCDQFRKQAEEFVRDILEDRNPRISLEDSLATMKILDAIRNAKNA